ncbi:MAG: TonB-dependent receptor [Gemmatimonadota bacterium]|nr:TonB-dependent receptor [Gemmatimonadota bacterium]
MRFRSFVRFLAITALLAPVSDLAAQTPATLAGRVTDDSGAGVSGAQVVVVNQVTGRQSGALSQADGRYIVVGLRAGGPYRVEVRIIGYGLQAVDGIMLEAGQTRTIDFRVSQEAIAIDAIEVFASRAIERKTPVAYSDIDKVQIQNQLGSRDLPLVLNVTPSVYATAQGGGAGDARINVRGFSQRNTAVMINGVPVNDMENGWVYWSNWDGLGDASTSIQLQRGLSAVNLATPSIGGTLNVITDPTSVEAGVTYKQEFGSGRFLKESIFFNTGENNGLAVSGAVVRKTGNGIYDGGVGEGNHSAWTDAWAYYFASSYQVSPNNRLEFYAVGAPQRHGQNLYKLNIGQLNSDYAASLEGYDAAALARYPEAGRTWSPNVGAVSTSYTGQQYSSTGPGGGGPFDRHAEGYINERENYFHKPQVNLNWYSYLGNGMTWSTVTYYSGGNGGGSGTLGSLRWAYAAYDVDGNGLGQRFADWDATIARNAANATGSRGILRNSVNNQWTIGAISKLRKDFDSGITGEVGVDWRTASIDHYREVRDLLGGAYYLDDANEFTTNEQRGLGEKIDYDNTNEVDWIGAYVQAEKSDADGSFYGMAGWSQIAYNYTDHFRRAAPGSAEELTLSSGNMTGYQVKGGARRNVTDEWSVFGNAGYVSKVPVFDGVISDADAAILDDPKNERFLSFESGLNYRGSGTGVSFDLNLYHTTWRDRTFNLFVRNLDGAGEDGLVRLFGVDARHMGVEVEGAYQPSDLFRVDAAASIGFWKYLDDADGQYVSADQTTVIDYSFYIGDLKVADAPQSQLALSASVFPLDGMSLSVVGRMIGRHYAEFSPASRCITTGDRQSGVCEAEAGTNRATEVMQRNQPWQAPGYTVFDAHVSHRLGDVIKAWKGGDVRLFVNVYNLFNSSFVQDAVDYSSFNGYHLDDDFHDADSAEVFLGLPRTFNLGFQVSF